MGNWQHEITPPTTYAAKGTSGTEKNKEPAAYFKQGTGLRSSPSSCKERSLETSGGSRCWKEIFFYLKWHFLSSRQVQSNFSFFEPWTKLSTCTYIHLHANTKCMHIRLCTHECWNARMYGGVQSVQMHTHAQIRKQTNEKDEENFKFEVVPP